MEERDAIEVREVLRMAGWNVIERDIQSMIQASEERIRAIEVSGKTTEEIGSEYLVHKRYVDGLKDALTAAKKYHER